jgi:hypothetical protein
LNFELVPTPLVVPEVPARPAKAVTATVEMTIFRIWSLYVSAISAKVPFKEIETPVGILNFELVPTPLVEPEDPVPPANVVTEAVEMIILRIR